MSVIDWLLDSDPAIRWQVMRDLTAARPNEITAERAKVADEGWGAAAISARRQRADVTWSLENTHPGNVHFALEDGDGQPSHWNTLRALRVLRWSEQ